MSTLKAMQEDSQQVLDGIEDDGESYREEVERMAEERVRIEDRIKDRKDELDKIGDFAEAYCTGFKYLSGGNQAGYDHSPEKVRFVFKFPDGSVGSESFNLIADVRSLEQFLENHSADSVTDMVGASHACIYKKTGWELCNNASVSPWKYYQKVSEVGDLWQINWLLPALFAVFQLTLFVVGIGFADVGSPIFESVSRLLYAIVGMVTPFWLMVYIWAREAYP